jgi:hypothetical protein
MSHRPASRLPLDRHGPARPLPEHVDLLHLAEEIVGSLMTTGQGETADRLALMQAPRLPGGSERNLGGWSASAAISAVEQCLKGYGR